jgi:hypothetical protein
VKLIGLMPVRNEAWVLGLSLRAAMMWVDEIVVLNHCSTDETGNILREIKAEYRDRLHILEDDDPVWHEMALRQRMLQAARSLGATHLALVDADEVLTGNLLPTIRAEIERTAPGTCVMIPWRCLWRSLNSYRSDKGSAWAEGFASVWFADSKNLFWKDRDGYDFHHRHPMGANLEMRLGDSGGGLMHLQFVNWRRLRAKQALYKMTEAIRWPNYPVSLVEGRYNPAVDERGLQTAEVPLAWWKPYARLMVHLQTAADPWQEVECQRLMALYGPEKFAGLDLFGVVDPNFAAAHL